MKFWEKKIYVKRQNIDDDYICHKNLFPMDLHIKAYQLIHRLLLLYDFRPLHYSVTLLSQRWNPFPSVCSDLDINCLYKYSSMICIQTALFKTFIAYTRNSFHSLISQFCKQFWRLQYFCGIWILYQKKNWANT